MLKSFERFWIFVQELKVKNSLRSHASTMENSGSFNQTVSTLESLQAMTKLRKVQKLTLLWGMFSERIVLPDVHQVFHWSDSPKKSRGKGSQRKNIVDDSQETVDVSEEYEPEPEPVKRKTASRRVAKKKVIIFADDNIIPDPDVALELSKSISLAEVEEEEEAKQVYATHARIVTESVLESAKKKTSSKSMLLMQGLGSSEGTGTIPGVPDESTVISATSSEGTGTKPGVPDEEKDITKENVILEWGSEQESEYSKEDQLDNEEKDDKKGDVDDESGDHISDDQDTDDEDDETESDKDEIYKYKIRVRKDEDEEMLNAEVE
ncbi:hypothetical protein Tco_0773696 [Tanacetum coccineum]|uniref:Uncharacterized protein n=1 Tax=Tanacetum coccineum TaxID=301880 RepID=A0ABQ4ZPY8_9ASTR